MMQARSASASTTEQDAVLERRRRAELAAS